jgi:6-pyruvoyltetrahydropterin/6-carboxytetrahydropterin synthase
MKTSIYRKEHFNAAHRLHNQNWDEQKNINVFGKCYSPNYHGHNYEILVKVTGDVNPETGYVIDTKILSDLIKELILIPFDHKNLNLDVIHFTDLNPTAENIARVIYELLRPKIESNLELKITLYETPRNFVEYPG